MAKNFVHFNIQIFYIISKLIFGVKAIRTYAGPKTGHCCYILIGVVQSQWRPKTSAYNPFPIDKMSQASPCSITLSMKSSDGIYSFVPQFLILTAKKRHITHIIANHPHHMRIPLATCSFNLSSFSHYPFIAPRSRDLNQKENV